MQNIISTDLSSPSRFAWLSIAAALTTIVMKSSAYLMTGSISLLSDAIESVLNLMGALMALRMFTIAACQTTPILLVTVKPNIFPVSYMGAAAVISYTAIDRIIHPRALEQMSVGLLVSTGASAVNFVVARIIMKAGKKYNSITLPLLSRLIHNT